MGWGCSRCGRAETTLPDENEAYRRKIRGCDSDAPNAKWIRCPWSQLRGGETEIVNYWRRWQRLGVWPFAGGADEQPAWVIQAFDHLSADEGARKDQPR